jgi:ornithine cyclodeaminase/alanine dehydrogenase-like protein (mu-crystallin family)
MTLILNNEEVESVLTMDDCLEVLEEAFKDLGRDAAVNQIRVHTYVSMEQSGISYRLKTMNGAVPRYGVMALRIASDVVHFPKVAGLIRQEKVAAAPGKKFVGLVQLFSLETGEPLAIIQDGYLQAMRVGATSALGAKYLARKNARVLGLFGSGLQAANHILAFSKVRNLEKVKVFSPNPEHRKRFAAEWQERLGIPVTAEDKPETVVRGSDMVMSCTNTNEPTFKGEWLEEGTHVGNIANSDEAVKRIELDEATLKRADVIIINSRQQAEYAGQSDLLDPIERGEFTWDKIHELGKLLIGAVRGRTHDKQITVYKNNVGMGIQFAAVGARICELAKKQGLGREVPTDWFLESIHP